MQNEHSTNKPRSLRWPVTSGVVLTVAKSWPGAGHSGLATVSPCGLTIGHGYGHLLYRRGFLMRHRGIEFYLDGGTLYANDCNAKRVTFSMLPLSRLTRTVLSSHTFISLRCTKHPNGSRTWLCTPVLVIRRKNRKSTDGWR